MIATAWISAVAAAIALGIETRPAAIDAPDRRRDARDECRPAAELPIPGPSWDLIVVDRSDRSPVAGAIVWVRSHGGRVRTWAATTDDQGRYTIVPPDEATRSFDVTVVHPGYAPNGLRAGVGAANVTLELERAEPIGGGVWDERGRPIAGARVCATAYPAAIAWPEIAADPNGGLVIVVSHPEHVAKEFRTNAATARTFASAQLLRAGRSVSGTVLSPFGRPVHGAAVLIATPPWDDRIIRLTTDREGRFRTGRCLDPGWPKVVLSVQYPGLAWDFRDVALSPEDSPRVIWLTGRRPIEGRVVDDRGRPVVGAAVSANDRYFNGLLDWETRTDATGRFVWHDAPTDGVLLIDVSRPGFWPLNRSVVRPGMDEVTITLHAES
jgi:protocatechuate 3,4-dioxygenase beta subunit